jgi:hypothetical protein
VIAAHSVSTVFVQGAGGGVPKSLFTKIIIPDLKLLRENLLIARRHIDIEKEKNIAGASISVLQAFDPKVIAFMQAKTGTIDTSYASQLKWLDYLESTLIESNTKIDTSSNGLERLTKMFSELEFNAENPNIKGQVEMMYAGYLDDMTSLNLKEHILRENKQDSNDRPVRDHIFNYLFMNLPPAIRDQVARYAPSNVKTEKDPEDLFKWLIDSAILWQQHPELLLNTQPSQDPSPPTFNPNPRSPSSSPQDSNHSNQSDSRTSTSTHVGPSRICSYCNRRNHFANQCFQRIEDEKATSNQTQPPTPIS